MVADAGADVPFLKAILLRAQKFQAFEKWQASVHENTVMKIE
jgi:hypothetical protein